MTHCNIWHVLAHAQSFIFQVELFLSYLHPSPPPVFPFHTLPFLYSLCYNSFRSLLFICRIVIPDPFLLCLFHTSHYISHPSDYQTLQTMYLLICTNECTIFSLKYYTNISLLYNYTCSYMFRPLEGHLQGAQKVPY